MSLESEIRSLERGRFHYFPVVPGRVEFASELRRLLLADKPPIVAVEFARRSISENVRPTFSVMEAACKEASKKVAA